jgi:hypothetical protein
MPDADWIRSADYNQLALRIVDPLLHSTQQLEIFESMNPSQRYLAVLWTLHTTCCRNGISSYLAEQPTWIPVLTGDAATFYGLARLASLWKTATQGMNLAAQFGRIPSRVRWTHKQAADELQQELVAGEFSDFIELASIWIRKRADAFAAPDA